MSTLLEHGQRKPFRRRRFLAPHRRQRLLRRLLKPFAGALVIAAVPLIGAFWFLNSTHFRIREVAVTDTERVSPQWIEARLRQVRGKHIFWLSLDDVRELLAPHPWVRGVEMRRVLPARVEIRIREEQPVALLKDDDSLFFLNRDGEIIAPYESRESSDLLVVSASRPEPAALRAGIQLLEEWRRSGSVWAGSLSGIEVLSERDFRVFVAGLPFPLVVNRDQLGEGLLALERYLPEIERRFPRLASADLRFSGQIVFKPVAPDPPREG
jgi:hypothetical protein